MLGRLSRLGRDERGLAGTALVIIISWALAAVLMLTGTLIAAQQIDDRVATIVNEVSPIDEDLDSVELAVDTNRIARGILDAAEPLSGQLDDVIGSVGGISPSVDEILTTAGSINDTVLDIGDNARSIGSTVDGIHSNLSAVLGEVRTIESGVTAINIKAATAISLVTGIRSDLDQVLALLQGHGTPANANIHGHANSIDCSPAVAPQSRHCGD